MRPIKNVSRLFKPLMLVLLSATILSFSVNWGGDSFRIFLNDKLVVEQYVSQQAGVKSIQLSKASSKDQVVIYYSHCGQTGKDRSITIKDGNNRVLKQWHFPDVDGSNVAMICKAGDILTLQKNNGADKLNLYYSSKELANGRLLANIILSSDPTTNQ